MTFLGQFVLEPRLFDVAPGRIAYLFMSENEEGELDTWDPAAGESALLLQQFRPGAAAVVGEGPQLLEFPALVAGVAQRPAEFSCHVEYVPVPEPVADYEVELWTAEQHDAYFAENAFKLGGKADWVQAEECPEGWRLLAQIPEFLQVDGEAVTLSWNFGTGIAYLLVNEEANQGQVVWQCA